MLEDVLQKYILAGKIASKVRDEASTRIREGYPVLKLCEEIESMIIKEGGKPAFPPNICVNQVAAHYTSPPADPTVIPEGAVVKVDIGVQVEGYIADTAITVSLDPRYACLVEAAEEALDKAKETIRSGVKASEIGRAIESTIKLRNLKPICNLQGHKIGRYLLHAGRSIPNVSHLDGTRLKAGEVYAIEPFVTTKPAKGRVVETSKTFIYRYSKDVPLSDVASSLLKRIKSRFRTLPFAKRWISGLVTPGEFEKAFLELVSSGALVGYPVLVEESECVVAQAESTIIVRGGGSFEITPRSSRM